MSKEFKELSTSEVLKLDKSEQNKYFEEFEIHNKAEKKALQDQITGMSADIDRLKKNGGKLSASGFREVKTAEDLLNQSFEENYEQIKSVKQEFPIRYAIKSAGNITIAGVSSTGSATNIPNSYASFGIITRPRRKITIRDLVPVIPSATGTFIYYRQPSNIGNGSFGFQAGQGNVKALLDKNLEQVIINCDYLSGTARVAKQMLADLGAMQSFLAADLLEDYRRSESSAFIPTLVAGATSFSPTATVTAEMIVQAIGSMMSNDFDANGIITDATTWAKVINTKPSNYSLPGGDSAIGVNADGVITFLGIPVLVQNNMVAGNIIVGDFTRAAIIQAEGLSVAFFDQDQDNVVRNLVTARVEARVGFTVMRKDAFQIFTAGTT